jgi:hypothetical protein
MAITKGKNINKYLSYRMAHSRIKRSIQNHYYLEAITLQESILSDRIISIALENQLFTIKETEVHKNLTLGCLINRLSQSNFEYDQIITQLNEFNKKRNTCIHAMVKSFPGKAPLNMVDFRILSQETCNLGNKVIASIKSLQSKLRASKKKIVK